MSAGGGEGLVWAVALAALVLLPLASWLIAGVGSEISAELDGGRTGSSLGPPRHPDDDLRAEVRSMVLATNERRRRAGKPPVDVEVEIDRRLDDAAGA